MGEHCCEEVEGMIGSLALRCNAPAYTLVKHRGRDEGPYWMCPEHASHNIANRNAEDVTAKEKSLIMQRRIVTDGTIFRLQHRVNDTQEWAFYPDAYMSADEARIHLENMNRKDAAEDYNRWTVVE